MNVTELEHSDKLLLKSVAGSHLYGLNTPSSDYDIRGIFMDDPTDIFDVTGEKNQEIADDGQDVKYYSLKKFLKLASECNPNIIELLWLPQEAILFKSPIYEDLVSHRDWFMSTRAKHTFGGYAYSQVKRAKGINKKGNSVSKYVNDNGIRILRMLLNQPANLLTRVSQSELNGMWIRRVFGGDFVGFLKKENVPWDENDKDLCKFKGCFDTMLDAMGVAMTIPDVTQMLPPNFSDFVYWYRNDSNGFPFRKCSFKEDISNYDASRVEGLTNLYRLYHNHDGKGGFIDELGMNVIVKSIDKEREVSDFAGVVSICLEEYQRARKEYESFWEWMNNRNEARYTNDWDSEGQVDWKNLMHTMRLLLCCKSIAETGIPKVRFYEKEREYLLNIRNGVYSYNDIMDEVDRLMKEVDGLFEKSKLPRSANIKAINQWYKDTMRKYLV